MAKTKASKIYKEDEEEANRLSINGVFADKEEEELMSVNAALDQEKEMGKDKEKVVEEEIEDTPETELEHEANKKELTAEENKNANIQKPKGIKVPPPKALRNPKKDKDPIEGEDLGLAENDFLLSRKITQQDLNVHNRVNKEALLGSNVRKARDLKSVFSRGPSSKEQPKVDTMYAIENNEAMQKEIAATQLLRNYHSSNNKETNNMTHILKELKVTEEIMKEIKEDKKAEKNQKLIDIIKELL